MGSPGPEDRNYVLRVHIQDGKGFGPETQAVACTAMFAGEAKTTPYSVGREAHVWNVTLQWRLTLDNYRRLTSLGQKDCKVVLTAKDGDKLGWFVLDLRAAKLQHQYKKDEGELPRGVGPACARSMCELAGAAPCADSSAGAGFNGLRGGATLLVQEYGCP
jgi:hypothetical protein